MLLACGEWDEAAATASQVPAEDPYGSLAARLALCALIGRGDPEAVTAALGHAVRSGLPAAELEVFETWSAIAAGRDLPDELSAAGAPLLTVLLELLLRGGDVERFQALLPALHRCRVDPRERHEMLAELYLGQGLLARAAQEWMAAADPVPDARALFGLARVAERNDMAQDAVTFATGALELDPQSAGAAAMLNRLESTRVAAGVA